MGFFDRFKPMQPSPSAPLPLEPVNDLERHLSNFVSGQAPIQPFLEELLHSQVFLLFHGKPTPAGPPSPLKPLVLPSSQGFPGIAAFTHPDRALPIQKSHPEYEAGLLVEFSWVLQNAPAGLGMIINPGWAVTIEQPPDGLVAFRNDVFPGLGSAV